MMSALVSLSGGMDSTGVLHKAIQEHGSGHVQAVSFTYGSKHNQYENSAANNVARYYGVLWHLIDLGPVFSCMESNLLKTGDDIPEGHYEQDNMSQTVVPGRNMIFASILAGIAWTRNLDEVWMGIHTGDHAIYPDCREDFFHSMNDAVMAGTDNRVKLRAPFLRTDKTGILQKCGDAAPWGLTRTCYKDQIQACGKCGACQERLEAFRNIGVVDPLSYDTREALPKNDQTS